MVEGVQSRLLYYGVDGLEALLAIPIEQGSMGRMERQILLLRR